MARMLGNTEIAFESARSQFWVVDAKVSISSYFPLWHGHLSRTQALYVLSSLLLVFCYKCLVHCNVVKDLCLSFEGRCRTWWMLCLILVVL